MVDGPVQLLLLQIRVYRSPIATTFENHRSHLPCRVLCPSRRNMSSIVHKIKDRVRSRSIGSRSSFDSDRASPSHTREPSGTVPAVPAIPVAHQPTAGRSSLDNSPSYTITGTGRPLSQNVGVPMSTNNAVNDAVTSSHRMSDDYHRAAPPITPTRTRDPQRAEQYGTGYDTYPASGATLGHNRIPSNPVLDRTADGYPARRDSLKRKPVTTRAMDETPLTDQMSRMNIASTPNATGAVGAPRSQDATAMHDGVAKGRGPISLPEHMRLPPNFDLSHSEHTDVDESWQPAVTRQVVIPQRHEIVQEAVSRDVHVHHYFTYVQPIKVVEILPAKHYSYNAKTGVRTEIPAPEGWVMPDHMRPTQPDMTPLKSYSRHYMVDEEHPSGVNEPAPADFNSNQRLLANYDQVDAPDSLRQHGASYPQSTAHGTVDNRLVGGPTTSLSPTSNKGYSGYDNQALATTTSLRDDNVLPATTHMLKGNAPAQPTMGGNLAHQGQGIPASTAVRHDNIVNEANNAVQHNTLTHPTTTTTTTTQVRRY